MDKYFCTICKEKLPETFTISELKQTNNWEFKCHEYKINISELKNQGIIVLCPSCKQETSIATLKELTKKNTKNEPPHESPFTKYEKKT